MLTPGNLITVSDGPNDRQLVDAFYYAYGKKGVSPMFVQFQSYANETVKGTILATIRAISYEGNSGHNFIIEGHFSFVGTTTVFNFKGGYNARTRCGSLELVL